MDGMQDFAYPELQDAVSNSILNLQEGGVLEDIKSIHQPPAPTCLAATEFSETNQVSVCTKNPCSQYSCSHKAVCTVTV